MPGYLRNIAKQFHHYRKKTIMRLPEDRGDAPLSCRSLSEVLQLPVAHVPPPSSTLAQLPAPPIPYANDYAGKEAYCRSMGVAQMAFAKPTTASEPAGKNEPVHKASSHPGVASQVTHQTLGFLKGFFWDAPKAMAVDTAKLASDLRRVDSPVSIPLAIIDPKGTVRALQNLESAGIGLLKLGKLGVDVTEPGAILLSGPSGVRDDIKTAKSLVQPEIDDWKLGNEGEASGRGLFDLASMFIPGGGGDAAKAAEGATLAEKGAAAAAHAGGLAAHVMGADVRDLTAHAAAADVGDIAADATVVDSTKAAAAHVPLPFDLNSLAGAEPGAEPGAVTLRGTDGKKLTVPTGDLGRYVTLPPGSHEIWAQTSGPAGRPAVQLCLLSDPTVADVDEIARIIGRGNIEANTDPMAGVPRDWTTDRAEAFRENAPNWMPEKFLANQTSPESSYWRKLSVLDQNGQWTTVGVVGGEVNEKGEQWYSTLYFKEGLEGRSGFAQRLRDGFLKWVDPTKPIHGVVAPHNKQAFVFHGKSGFHPVPGTEHTVLGRLRLVNILRPPESLLPRTNPPPFVPGIIPGRLIPASESGLPIETWFAKKNLQLSPDGDTELWLNLEAGDPRIHARIELKPSADGGLAAYVTDLHTGGLPAADMLSLMLKQDPRASGITSIVFPSSKDADALQVFPQGGRPETLNLAQLGDSIAASLGRMPTSYEFKPHSVPSGTGGTLDFTVRLGQAVRHRLSPDD